MTDAPTDAFKAQYQKSYGPPYRPHHADFARCAAYVPDGGRSPIFHQCCRKNGHGPESAWCKTHDPVAVAAKRKARDQKWNAEANASRLRWAFERECQQAIRDIAAGHNDPRALAQSIIDKLEKLV